MIDVIPRHLDTVTRILVAHVPECEVRAFGSRVNFTAKDYSDLDLVVVGERALDPDVLRLLREAFEESDLPFRVDVLDWHAVRRAFQEVIEKKYEVLDSATFSLPRRLYRGASFLVCILENEFLECVSVWRAQEIFL